MNAAISLIRENKKREVFRDKRQIQIDQLKSQGSYTRSRVKIRFPDNMVIVASFGAKETVQDVYDFVKSHLLVPERAFILFETPPKRVLSTMSSRLVQIKLVPSCTLYFGWTDLLTTTREDGPFLNLIALKQYISAY